MDEEVNIKPQSGMFANKQYCYPILPAVTQLRAKTMPSRFALSQRVSTQNSVLRGTSIGKTTSGDHGSLSPAAPPGEQFEQNVLTYVVLTSTYNQARAFPKTYRMSKIRSNSLTPPSIANDDLVVVKWVESFVSTR